MISKKRVSSFSIGHGEDGLPFLKRFKGAVVDPQTSLHNSESPILKLYHELLLKLFKLVAKTDLIAALRISQVSQHR